VVDSLSKGGKKKRSPPNRKGNQQLLGPRGWKKIITEQDMKNFRREKKMFSKASDGYSNKGSPQGKEELGKMGEKKTPKGIQYQSKHKKRDHLSPRGRKRSNARCDHVFFKGSHKPKRKRITCYRLKGKEGRKIFLPPRGRRPEPIPQKRAEGDSQKQVHTCQ